MVALLLLGGISCGVETNSEAERSANIVGGDQVSSVPAGIRHDPVCGAENAVSTQSYAGEFGYSVEFIRRIRVPVARLEDINGGGHCTGLMIAPDLLLTAAHCANTGDCSGGGTPSPSLTAVARAVFDYYQDGTYSGGVSFSTDSIVENSWSSGSCLDDYAILKISGSPGNVFGIVKTTLRPAAVGEDRIAIGQYYGQQQYVTHGAVTSVSQFFTVANLDVTPGMSGSPAFDSQGFVQGEIPLGVYGTPCGGQAQDLPYLMTLSVSLQRAVASEFMPVISSRMMF
jgi:hypothetical protein